MQHADIIIIGGGPGGYEVAAEQAAAGLNVVLIEREALGGTCLNRGCIPTKCLCAAADKIIAIADAADFGVDVADVKADFGRAASRMTTVVAGLHDDVTRALSSVNVITGEARLGANHTVMVNDETYTAPTIIIATGSQPAKLPIAGAETAITSDELLRLTSLPGRVAIIGGGVIGLEFASILSAFGCEVTVIEYCKEILPPFDGDIAKRLRSLLSRRGIKFVTGADVKSVHQGTVVSYESRRGEATVEADLVVMAVGRRPVLPDGLDAAGIELTPRGFIAVDEHYLTSVEGIYAVGDVNGKCMLAHAATAQARSVFGAKVNMDVIPSAVFTNPEAAMAGFTQEAAEAAGCYDVATVKLPVASNGKARAMGNADGLIKLIYDRASRRLLGCHAVGPHAADIIAEGAALMSTGVSIDTIADTIVHAHPTLSELLQAAAHMAR